MTLVLGHVMSSSEKYLQTWGVTDRKSYIQLTRAQLQFVAKATRYPLLIWGCHLENAVRRYETLWLPLCRQHGTMSCDEWAAPLDIAWVWYLHMLAPASYIKHCTRLIKNAPNHRSKSGEELRNALQTTERIWREAYDTEPFRVELSVPSPVKSFRSRIDFDFRTASLACSEFYYQVSLPHYHDESFLCAATQRYVRYLGLLRRYPDTRPPVDVRLIMQSHQLNPIFYTYQAGVILGRLTDPTWRSSDDTPGCVRAYEETRKVCESAGLMFHRAGAMYRGKPPLLADSEAISLQPLSMASVVYTADIVKVTVSNLSSRISYLVSLEGANKDIIYQEKIRNEESLASSRGYKARPTTRAARKDSDVKYMQLNDLHAHDTSRYAAECMGTTGYANPMYYNPAMTELELEDCSSYLRAHSFGDEDSSLASVHFSTPHNTTFTMALYETEESRFGSRKSLIGSLEMDTLECLGPFDTEKKCLAKTDSVSVSAHLAEQTISFEVMLRLRPKSFGPISLEIKPEFGFAKFSNLSKALTFPELMVPLVTYHDLVAPAEVTTYPVSDHRGNAGFSCRVIRAVTIADGLFAVEVLDSEGNVAATSHLLQYNVLPRKQDLQTPSGCVYTEPDEGDRAMLIHGQGDWGICIARSLTLPQVDQGRTHFLGLKLFIIKDSTFCYLRKYRNGVYLIELAREEGEVSSVVVDIEQRRVLMTNNMHQVPEVIALCFSILLLRYLSIQHDRERWVIVGENGLELFSPFQSADDIGVEWDGTLCRDRKHDCSYFVSDSWGYATL